MRFNWATGNLGRMCKQRDVFSREFKHETCPSTREQSQRPLWNCLCMDGSRIPTLHDLLNVVFENITNINDGYSKYVSNRGADNFNLLLLLIIMGFCLNKYQHVNFHFTFLSRAKIDLLKFGRI